MRHFYFDKYHTWHDWRLTLTGKAAPDPEPKTNYIGLDGAHGTLDLSEALTGEVTYNDRTVSASFWTSEGTFQERVALLRQVTSALHGKKVKIVEPDDPDHYFLGRVTVKDVEQDQVHIAFTLEAVCDPWRYAAEETVRTVNVSGDVGVVIQNNGEKSLTPVLTVTTDGGTGTVNVGYDGTNVALQTGKYLLPGLRLHQGANVVELSGDGTITFTYREALL